eukprot:679940-Amphidinium_carterae.1
MFVISLDSSFIGGCGFSEHASVKCHVALRLLTCRSGRKDEQGTDSSIGSLECIFVGGTWYAQPDWGAFVTQA